MNDPDSIAPCWGDGTGCLPGPHLARQPHKGAERDEARPDVPSGAWLGDNQLLATTTRKGFGQHRAPVYPEREKRIQGLDVTHEVTVYGRNQVLHVSSKEEEEEKAVL